MTDRHLELEGFVRAAGWSDATLRPLAGDASNRRYHRLERQDGTTAILMDAPPRTGEDVRPFVRIARHLDAAGLSAPRILAEDADGGFLLLEDLGDALFARVVTTSPEAELALYSAAVDTLVQLHRQPLPPGIGVYDADLMCDRARLAYDWYLKGVTGTVDAAAARDFENLLRAALTVHAGDQSVLALRDFHAENLIWLPDREGPRRVGLLDFQDALAGHPAYDLVSLLNDVRRDVSEDVRIACLDRFISATGADSASFLAAAATVSAQRNLRILGIFARLSLHFGKPAYVRLIPRVWALLMRDLEHPALSRLRARVISDLPPPTEAALAALEEQCAAPVR